MSSPTDDLAVLRVYRDGSGCNFKLRDGANLDDLASALAAMQHTTLLMLDEAEKKTISRGLKAGEFMDVFDHHLRKFSHANMKKLVTHHKPITPEVEQS